MAAKDTEPAQRRAEDTDAEAQWQAALAIARSMPPLTPAQRAIIAAALTPTPPHPS